MPPRCRRRLAITLPPPRRRLAAAQPWHLRRRTGTPLFCAVAALCPRTAAPPPPPRRRAAAAAQPHRSRSCTFDAASGCPTAPHTRPAVALPRRSRRLATAPLLRCSRFAVPPRPRSPEGQGPRRAVGPPLRAAAASPSRDGRGPAKCGRRGRPTAGQLQRHRRLALAVSPACAAAAWPSPRRRAPRRLPVAAARRAAAPFLPPRVRAQRRRLNTTPLRPRRRLAIALRQRRRLAAALRVRRHPHFTVAPLRRRRRSGATSVNGSGRRSRLDSCLLISTPELAIPDLATPVLAIPSSRDRDHATLAATRNSTTTRSRGHTAPCLGPRGNPGARPWLLPWLLATSAALPRPPGQPWRPALACATTSSDHCATHRCLAPARASSVPSRIATRQREPRSDFSTVLSPRRSTPHLRPWRLTPRPLAPADAIARPVSQRPIAPCAPVHPPRYRQHGHSPRKPPPRAHPTPTRPCDAAGLDSRSWLALSVRVLGWHSRLAFSIRALDPHSRFAQRQRAGRDSGAPPEKSRGPAQLRRRAATPPSPPRHRAVAAPSPHRRAARSAPPPRRRALLLRRRRLATPAPRPRHAPPQRRRSAHAARPPHPRAAPTAPRRAPTRRAHAAPSSRPRRAPTRAHGTPPRADQDPARCAPRPPPRRRDPGAAPGRTRRARATTTRAPATIPLDVSVARHRAAATPMACHGASRNAASAPPTPSRTLPGPLSSRQSAPTRTSYISRARRVARRPQQPRPGAAVTAARRRAAAQRVAAAPPPRRRRLAVACLARNARGGASAALSCAGGGGCAATSPPHTFRRHPAIDLPRPRSRPAIALRQRFTAPRRPPRRRRAAARALPRRHATTW